MIAQGVWMTQFGGKLPDGTEAPDAETGRPIVLWHSKMLESGDFVTAESFDSGGIQTQFLAPALMRSADRAEPRPPNRFSP